MNNYFNLSETTNERILSKILNEGKIIKIFSGRYIKYKWIN